MVACSSLTNMTRPNRKRLTLYSYQGCRSLKKNQIDMNSVAARASSVILALTTIADISILRPLYSRSVDDSHSGLESGSTSEDSKVVVML